MGVFDYNLKRHLVLVLSMIELAMPFFLTLGFVRLVWFT